MQGSRSKQLKADPTKTMLIDRWTCHDFKYWLIQIYIGNIVLMCLIQYYPILLSNIEGEAILRILILKPLV